MIYTKLLVEVPVDNVLKICSQMSLMSRRAPFCRGGERGVWSV